MEGYSVLINKGNQVIAVSLPSKDEAIGYIAYIYRHHGTKFNSAKIIPTHQLNGVMEYQSDSRFLAA